MNFSPRSMAKALLLIACLSLLNGHALGAPLAAGRQKYLGGISSSAQSANFAGYWNQVTPENAGKWGSVEATRDVMNWTELDTAYNLAKSNGFPFRMHILCWGNQQPAWIRDLPPAEQLVEIRQWYAAVAARYPDIDYLEVVNEALHDKPDITWTGNAGTTDCGNYKNALGGDGASGWEWVLGAFRLARQYFPHTPLVLNDYSIINDGAKTQQYLAIINLLKAENLVDIIAEQAHAFTTNGTSATTLTANLDALAATGLPVWITEFDIDGSTDAAQLAEYQRVFPVLWEHPSVIGITTWGYRPGLWRSTANLIRADDSERPALTWLRDYVAATKPSLRAMITGQPTSRSVAAGSATSLTATAKGTPTPTYQWQKNGSDIPGATGATLAFANAQTIDAATYRVVVTNSFNTVISTGATLTVTALAPSITTQPVSLALVIGASAGFSVVAGGTGPFTYQWQKDGADLPGATGATLAFAGVQFADAGTYRVMVTNSVTSVISDNATMVVEAIAPTITTQPVSRMVVAGTRVNFSVVANGTAPFTYHWQKNGVDILDATSDSYVIASVQSADAGTYAVVVSNGGGVATSDAATLSLGVISAGFDVNVYLARNPTVAAVYSADLYAAWIYYRNHGIYDGEVFDDLFRVEEYLALYPDLSALFGDDFGGALEHWLSTGRIEGRLGRIPLEFKAQGYFDRNPDVAAAVNNEALLAWGHYWLYGIYEGRAYDDELRVFEYLAINADLTAAFVNDWRQAALHWMRYGRTEGRLGRLPLTFNVTEYLNRSPDVAAVWGNNPTTVFLHFWLYGIDENRTYDDLFRPVEYLALNPDLAAALGTDRRSAFKHWVRYGMAEGRPGKNP